MKFRKLKYERECVKKGPNYCDPFKLEVVIYFPILLRELSFFSTFHPSCIPEGIQFCIHYTSYSRNVIQWSAAALRCMGGKRWGRGEGGGN